MRGAATSLISQKKKNLLVLWNSTNSKTLGSIIATLELSVAHTSCSWQHRSVPKMVVTTINLTCYSLIHTAEMYKPAFSDLKLISTTKFSCRMISSSAPSFRVPWVRRETLNSKHIFGLSLRPYLFDLECCGMTKKKKTW